MTPSTSDLQHDLRERLIDALEGANAHVPFSEVVRDLPADARDRRPAGAPHSLFDVLEHLRITTWDILEFSRDSKHASPSWPTGYWPAEGSTSANSAWEKSVAAYERDLKSFAALIADPKIDLFARIDHPDAKPHHTLAREAMVIVDHNGYHWGEMVLLRRLLGAWPQP